MRNSRREFLWVRFSSKEIHRTHTSTLRKWHSRTTRRMWTEKSHCRTNRLPNEWNGRYNWSPDTTWYVQRWTVMPTHRWMHSIQTTILRNGHPNRLHEFPAKQRKLHHISSGSYLALYEEDLIHMPIKALTWYWNKWSNVWFASTKISITATMQPNVTYKMLWMATICANNSTGSHCVFRKPDFIFIGCFPLTWPQLQFLDTFYR